MIKSVAREFKWPPNIIGGFFIDDADYYGLEYWYNDARQIIKEIKDSNKKEKN